MTTTTFQRARKPEEVSIRRQAILDAAAALFDVYGPHGAGLNAIAARAGFTKSNIYRYFESREEVLIAVLLADLELFLPDFEIAITMCPEANTAMLARAATRTFLEYPRLPRLLAILSTTLEQNVSVETLIAHKRAMSMSLTRIAFALHDKLPGTALEDCSWVAHMLVTVIAGMWPAAYPSDAAAEVLALAEFAHLKPMVERDLERAILALLRSIDSRWISV
jgi:AcrR family transcriptional regulator